MFNLFKKKIEYINQRDLRNAIGMIDNDPTIWNITDRLKNLSLDENTPGSSGSGSGRGSGNIFYPYNDISRIIDRVKRIYEPSKFTQDLMNQTKVPFLEIPKSITKLTEKSSDYVMSLGFRFLPGQSGFLSKNINLPDSLEGFKELRNKIGLTLSKSPLSSQTVLKLKGLSDYTNEKASMMSRVLVEAITYNNGYYGRFLILVKLGIGCTIWYGFVPGDGVNLPIESLSPLFNSIDNYDSFIYNPDVHVQPGFNKITLVEGEESPIIPLLSSFSSDDPFVEIEIPKSTNESHIVAVALGLTVVVLLASGIIPHIDG